MCAYSVSSVGVPKLLVPNNLKSGVNKVSFYDREIDRTYGAMAAHYSVADRQTVCVIGSAARPGFLSAFVPALKHTLASFRTMKSRSARGGGRRHRVLHRDYAMSGLDRLQ
jgi:hypothetical protein